MPEVNAETHRHPTASNYPFRRTIVAVETLVGRS